MGTRSQRRREQRKKAESRQIHQVMVSEVKKHSLYRKPMRSPSNGSHLSVNETLSADDVDEEFHQAKTGLGCVTV